MQIPTSEHECPDCKGKGQKCMHLNPGGWRWVVCWRCQGRKTVTPELMEQIRAGEEFRAFARRHGLNNELDCLVPFGVTEIQFSDAKMGAMPIDGIARIRQLLEHLIYERGRK